MSSAPMPPPPPPPQLPKDPPGPISSDTKKLVPILVVLGVLLCGCIAVPVLGGGAMLLFWSGARSAPPAQPDAVADQFDAINIPGGEAFGSGTGFGQPQPGVPGFGGGIGIPGTGDSKELARLNMQAAEQAL